MLTWAFQNELSSPHPHLNECHCQNEKLKHDFCFLFTWMLKICVRLGITNAMDVSLSELRELGMDREAWHAAIHGVSRSWTRLSDWTELKPFFVAICHGKLGKRIKHCLWLLPSRSQEYLSQLQQKCLQMLQKVAWERGKIASPTLCPSLRTTALTVKKWWEELSRMRGTCVSISTHSEQLCDLGKVANRLWASVSARVKQVKMVPGGLPWWSRG